MPNWFIVVILAVVFTAVLSVGQGFYWAYVAQQEKHQREVLRRLGIGGSSEHEEDDDSIFRDEEDATANALGGVGVVLQEYIVMSDSPLTVSKLLTRCGVMAFIGALIGGYFLSLMGFIFAVPAGLIPILLLRHAAKKRTYTLISQLPDSLDLMARSLQAGLSLNDALRLVVEEMPLPVAAEFGRIFEEIRFGRDYRDAFTQLVTRNPGVFDLRLLVSSILLQRETGGNLIEILESISETIRSRFVFEAKVRAMTSESRFTAYLLGSLPIIVTVMIGFSSPSYLTPLISESVGHLMLLYCFCSYAIGIFIMRDLSNVEV
ncbi:MAG: type II secretion system F family protein [Proteobacteria bacterium]|nr:type II secretion system F family protein [Pseudomonadota bacterium]